MHSAENRMLKMYLKKVKENMSARYMNVFVYLWFSVFSDIPSQLGRSPLEEMASVPVCANL